MCAICRRVILTGRKRSNPTVPIPIQFRSSVPLPSLAWRGWRRRRFHEHLQKFNEFLDQLGELFHRRWRRSGRSSWRGWSCWSCWSGGWVRRRWIAVTLGDNKDEDEHGGQQKGNRQQKLTCGLGSHLYEESESGTAHSS